MSSATRTRIITPPTLRANWTQYLRSATSVQTVGGHDNSIIYWPGMTPADKSSMDQPDPLIAGIPAFFAELR